MPHITLTSEQSARWEEGAWSSWRIEEDILEDVIRHNITEPVIVHLDTGEVLFAISQGVIQ